MTTSFGDEMSSFAFLAESEIFVICNLRPGEAIMYFGEINFADGVFDRCHLVCLFGCSPRNRKASELMARHKPRTSRIHCQTDTFNQHVIIAKLPGHIRSTEYGRCRAVSCRATIVKSERISHHRSIQHLLFGDFHLKVSLWITRTVVVILNRYLGQGLTSDLKLFEVSRGGESEETRRGRAFVLV